MTRPIRALAVAAFLVLAAGLSTCGGAGPADEPVVRDSAGVRVVENAEPGAERVAFTLEPEPAVSIGVLDGDPAYIFQGVRDAARLPDGRIVVADGSELRWYDAAGRHLRTVGGEGEGPGEFTFLVSVVYCGNRLLAGDVRQQRLTAFDLDGELLGTGALPASGNMVFSLGLEGCDARTGLPLFRVPPPTRMGEQDAEPESVMPILRVDVAGDRVDTVARVPIRPRPTRGVASPLAPATAWAFGSTRLHFMDTDRFEVRSYDLDGELRQITRVQHAPQPVTAADHRLAIEALLEQMPESFAPIARQQLEDATVPSHRPVARTIAVDGAGRVWIQPFTPPGEDRATDWLVLGNDGAYLGTVELPERFRPRDLGEDWVLGVMQDELDVSYVRLYRYAAARRN